MKSDKDALSVNEISELTYIHPEDVVVALRAIGVKLDQTGEWVQEEPTLYMKKCRGLMELDQGFECLGLERKVTVEPELSVS